MVAHEYAHGYAALRQGDETAFKLGRLTWNPVKHIDPFMTVLLPLMTFIGSGGGFIFGGAKPVPVDPRKYAHYRRGDIIVSLAGVAVNLVLAVLCALLIVPLGMLGQALPSAATTIGILQRMLSFGILFNLILVLFNLLPIPPLDGSHVVKHLLPPRLSASYERVGRYGMIILILLLTPIGRPVLDWWMSPLGIAYGAASRVTMPYVLPGP